MRGTPVATAVFLVVLGGCRGTTRTGTPYTQSITRELSTYISGPIDVVHTNARQVLEHDLGFVIIDDALDSMEGTPRETARGRTVKVETARQGDGLTRVEVWVSPMGDEPIAREILSLIDERT